MSKSLLLAGGALQLPSGCKIGDIAVEEGRIVAVGERLNRTGAEVVGLEGYSVSPGLIDIHMHGCGGAGSLDCSVEAWRKVSKTAAEHGVTSFCGATFTTDPDHLIASVKAIAAAVSAQMPGARLLGCHLEGPFISSSFAGIQPRELVAPLKKEVADEYLAAGEGTIRLVTMTGDKPESLRLIEHFAKNGVIVSLGHTGASYEQVKTGMKYGAKSITHTFNAMAQLDRRHPNTVGAALVLDELYCELICDLHHVHPACVEILLRCKPPEKIVLVSDATRVSLQPDGYYELAGHVVRAHGGQVLNEEGRLAGAWYLLDEGVRNLITKLDVPPHQAFLFATLNPAALLGERQIGRLEVGMAADVAVWDENWQPVLTLVNGEIAYSSPVLAVGTRELT